MHTLCVIGARGGSEGVVGKNLRRLLGKPLICRAVEQALAVKRFQRVVVSTDSEEIAKLARAEGAAVPFVRPTHLSTAQAGKFEVWKHALDASEETFGESYDTLTDLDCTFPLRETADIEAALDLYESLDPREVDCVMTMSPSRRNPYFNLLEIAPDGRLMVSKPQPERVVARQAAPETYEHASGVYVLRTSYVRAASHYLEGRAVGLAVSPEKAYDIDSELDFDVVEFLLSRKHQG